MTTDKRNEYVESLVATLWPLVEKNERAAFSELLDEELKKSFKNGISRGVAKFKTAEVAKT